MKRGRTDTVPFDYEVYRTNSDDRPVSSQSVTYYNRHDRRLITGIRLAQVSLLIQGIAASRMAG